MTAKIIDGIKISLEILEEVRNECVKLKYKGIVPGLAVIRVGDDPASKYYVNLKDKRAKEIGIYSRQITLPEDVSEEELIKIVDELNEDPKINGFFIQLPLPKHINKGNVLDRIKPEKDVDGLSVYNFGKLLIGHEQLVPATPKGVLCMLRRTGIDVAGKEVCVVGASNIVGKPLAMMLLNRRATVTICHSKTKDLASHTKKADIIAVAVGKPGLITKEMVKEGAVVIDIGTTKVDGKLKGDVADDVADVAGYITPVPGGVGPMTVACLMENTVKAAIQQNGLDDKNGKDLLGCACEHKSGGP
ncbi:MAG: tetrahydrofolate dehydrogenase/cyclohydrolase catalytic domain-containing protein [Candidatus Diapherotrites archaeon]